MHLTHRTKQTEVFSSAAPVRTNFNQHQRLYGCFSILERAGLVYSLCLQVRRRRHVARETLHKARCRYLFTIHSAARLTVWLSAFSCSRLRLCFRFREPRRRDGRYNSTSRRSSSKKMKIVHIFFQGHFFEENCGFQRIDSFEYIFYGAVDYIFLDVFLPSTSLKRSFL